MGSIHRFEDLKIWQSSRELSHEVYGAILKNQNIKDYSLKDQINRSSGSIMDNIAEGFEHNGNKEFKQFLSIAKSSCSEGKLQLYRAKDRELINQTQFEDLYNRCDMISKMIHGFIKYLNTSDLRASNMPMNQRRNILQKTTLNN